VVFVAEEEYVPPVGIGLSGHLRDTVDHRPLEILLHHGADGLGESRIGGRRKIEGADGAGLQELAERRKRLTVTPVVVCDWVIGLFRRAEDRLTAGLSSNKERNTDMPSTIELRNLGSIRIQSW